MTVRFLRPEEVELEQADLLDVLHVVLRAASSSLVAS